MDGLVKHRSIVAVVPARGGSKSIPGKNVKLLGGIPLIAYSIAAGLSAKLVDRVIVSTDDPAIADIGKEWGASVPFLRPKELAGDHVIDLPVFRHALEWLEENEKLVPDIIIQLRPTSPFRPPGCVDEAVQLLLSHPEADSVRGITPSGQNPYKMWKLDGHRMVPIMQSEYREPYNMPRQKLPPTYWQTGHIEVIRRDTIMEKESMTGDIILPYVVGPEYAIDLDNLVQWAFAEHMLDSPGFSIIAPGIRKSGNPGRIRLAVFDFDGVMTDDKVYVDQNGGETVRCSRSDGMGVGRLKKAGVAVLVLSTEVNPVVKARCDKLGIECVQGIGNKTLALEKIAKQYHVAMEEIAYVGNDINDLGPMEKSGFSAAVADAHPEVLRRADLVLDHCGGEGAVREFCERIISEKRGEEHVRSR